MKIRLAIYDEINAERDRQDAKFGWIGTTSTMAGDDEFKKLGVLREEYGEVARALLERDPQEHLEEELVQCAAVCVAWIEAAREKREPAPKHHYVVAATYHQASMAVRHLALPAYAWTWADNAATIDGLTDTATVVVFETWAERRNFTSLCIALAHARERGVEVLHLSSADLG